MLLIIKGLDMPQNCWECPCYNQELFMCQVTGIEDYDDDGTQRREDCPLIEIPKDDEDTVLSVLCVLKGVKNESNT